ncbi:NAD(P)-binding domain-containing protein [Modicisalibacter radicis]|uniref:NAD(P)-binding domain-containing protein n=1 Tax=Halomonas sp. EAR18 TaxID=2518972 RepID=UPI001B353A8C
MHYSNLIIGGGPAGLNLGLELYKRGLNFFILEGREAVGGQWDKIPVCGQLISLNKKYVPGNSHSYRMRYDWHTLSSISEEDVENDPRLLFTNWTSDHWPSAKLYKKYLQYVARATGLLPCIRQNARVTRVSKKDGVFVVEINKSEICTADRVFCGTGKTDSVMPDIKGLNANTCKMYEDFDPATA